MGSGYTLEQITKMFFTHFIVQKNARKTKKKGKLHNYNSWTGTKWPTGLGALYGRLYKKLLINRKKSVQLKLSSSFISGLQLHIHRIYQMNPKQK